MRRIILLLALVTVSCGAGGSSTTTSGCGPPVHDRLDPRSVVHVLPGADVPPYLTNPPTSGEHQPVAVPRYRGVRRAPLLPQIQVALLESSQVLVQYTAPAGPAPLAPLAGNRLVTVAPDPGLPAPVVASAWEWRLVCANDGPAAVAAIQTFVDAHAGAGPQPPPP